MARTTCLQIKEKNGCYRDLFTGAEELPHFWLMLIENEHIESLRKRYREAELNQWHKETVDTDIKINKDAAITNAIKRRNYIYRLYGEELLGFYDQWIAFIKHQQLADGIIYLDLLGQLERHTDPDAFLDRLNEILLSLAFYQPTFFPTLGETSGWQSANEDCFAAFSRYYKTCLVIENSLKAIG